MAVTVICIPCGAKMTKETSGHKIKMSDDFCMYADKFTCPRCGRQVLSDTGKPHPDRQPDIYEYDLRRSPV